MTNLHFVGFDDRHVPARVAWLEDPRVRSSLPITGEITEVSTMAWCRRVADDTTRADFVLEDPAGRPLVMCGVTHVNELAGRGEVYMFADPDRHGRGHGSLALRHLCDWAFGERDLNRLFLYTMAHNDAARRFYERGGFAQEGRLREHESHDGALVDRYIHGLLRGEHQVTSVGDARG